LIDPAPTYFVKTWHRGRKKLKSFKPILQLSSYYLIAGLLVTAVLLIFPATQDWLPVGGNADLTLATDSLLTGKVTEISWEPISKALELTLSMVGVIILMKPVAWVYMGARRRRGREQSFVMTLLLLPLAVAGIVIIVENSIALAFSLAGIVAGVRFRLTLDDTLDAIYIFMSIGVGLAAGIGALEIAVVLSMFFNFSIVLLWQSRYGENASNRWFARSWINPGDVHEPESTEQIGEENKTPADDSHNNRP
jgi:hypothetical protein